MYFSNLQWNSGALNTVQNIYKKRKKYNRSYTFTLNTYTED